MLYFTRRTGINNLVSSHRTDATPIIIYNMLIVNLLHTAPKSARACQKLWYGSACSAFLHENFAK